MRRLKRWLLSMLDEEFALLCKQLKAERERSRALQDLLHKERNFPLRVVK